MRLEIHLVGAVMKEKKWGGKVENQQVRILEKEGRKEKLPLIAVAVASSRTTSSVLTDMQLRGSLINGYAW